MRPLVRLLVVLSVSLSFAVPTPAAASKRKPPTNTKSRVQHIVVVMMENRSFDHLLGWHPTAEAEQHFTYYDADGAPHDTMPLAPNYMGCEHPDPDHSWAGGRSEYDGGLMDGWLVTGTNDVFSIGFYGESDRPFFNALARNYTTADHFFAAIMAETYPNRIFQHAAQTDRLTNTLDLSTLPTIWDRLAEKGVSAKYYYSDVSFLWLWGVKYLGISAPYEEFVADAAAGNLPAVAFVEPRFVEESTGTSGDDHPHADVRAGDAFLARTFDAVAASPDWPRTVFIATYDEWGGFFDHVVPPRAAAANDVDPDIVDGKTLLGMRVPVVIASPFTRGDPTSPRVVSMTFDHTSVLKLIEWRYGLAPLTARDASTDVGNLLDALDFSNVNAAVPDLPQPSDPDVTACLNQIPADVGLDTLGLIAPAGVAVQ